MEYVSGLMFNLRTSEVALLRKTKPEHLADRWLGVGGKIENQESAFEAMVREFKEEAGKYHDQWQYVTTFEGIDGMTDSRIHIFATNVDNWEGVYSAGVEEIKVMPIKDVLFNKKLAPNMRMIIGTSLDLLIDETSVDVIYRHKTKTFHGKCLRRSCT